MERSRKTGQALPADVEQMVQRVASDDRWTDLALPAAQSEVLRAIALRAQQAAPTTKPRVTALFVGSDSSARVKAASMLATALGADLYRVDLSQFVSKYIGETEKNLERLLAAAERADVVLFFDEADALFGKRTDVKDAHDHYANLEINYVLERLEAFQGIAILATNRKASLDDAFTRRIRYVVDFAAK
jgi:SpoVK/Ycf46/Vps4 family AAA+-type ATPase